MIISIKYYYVLYQEIVVLKLGSFKNRAVMTNNIYLLANTPKISYH
jgi:hypothetical protein